MWKFVYKVRSDGTKLPYNKKPNMVLPDPKLCTDPIQCNMFIASAHMYFLYIFGKVLFSLRASNFSHSVNFWDSFSPVLICTDFSNIF